MSNLRIVYQNEAELSSTTITASTTSGSLVASNMKTDYKGQVHRSTGTSVTYTVTFAQAKQIGCVALPATNLSSTALIRVRAYNSAIVVFDSGQVYACPGSNLELWDWSLPLNANAFIFGGASKTAIWLDNQQYATSVVIDITDASNASGKIDCAKIVAGPYWEPTYNASTSISTDLVDMSDTSRNDSGDLLSDRSIIYDVLSFDFSILTEQDRASLLKLLRKIGTAKNILVSIFPDNNSLLEQTNMIYGKRSNNSMDMELFGFYNHTMEIEGW